ncbi:hypothetical protein SAMN05518871_106180 [Psychrobacillus sp. OK028]|uniref:hypothetical protein n=1 Tax=Psychrobacillus sp. OK028 TaxID=1884359 RepID=UPI0008870E14|nr:hypothetical protein [Psychrobacillus sp. OK028]SDN62883.1 hypothetical protein SAMN05518871_106180 [Psychrobacillus sp. OK028]
MIIWWNVEIVEQIMIFLGWIITGIIAFRLYKTQLKQPVVWKVVLIILIGLFTFSINLEYFGRVIQIPILPLGVWLLYLFLRKNKEKWQKYRPFAWLGFGANFILLISLLVGIPINNLLYPGNDPSIYISNVEDAYIINTHPTANEVSFVTEKLVASLQGAEKKDYFSDSWYNEIYLETQKTERFPYILANTFPKWGSGIRATIFLENNGKGILITSQEKQLYFQTKQSLFEEGNK